MEEVQRHKSVGRVPDSFCDGFHHGGTRPEGEMLPGEGVWGGGRVRVQRPREGKALQV